MSTPFSNDKFLAQFRQKLHEESQLWEDENLLSPEQREAILLRYQNIPAESHAAPASPVGMVREFPLFIRAILALSVFLVGLAVFLLISFNWHYLSGAAKLSIVGTVLAVAHGGGFWLRKTGWKNWSEAAFFFAAIMYGVAIWQVGQVFHLPADWPEGLWLWAFGVFLMALVLGSTPIHLLSVALLTAWVIAAMIDSASRFMTISTPIAPLNFIPFFAWSLPLFATLGIVTGILKQNRFALPLYSLLLLFWWILQGVGCRLDFFLTFHIIAAGLICLAVSARFFEAASGIAMRCVGILLVFGGLIAPSFLGYWEVLCYWNVWGYSRSADGYIIHIFWAFILPVADFFILFGLFRWGNRKESLRDLIRHNKAILAWVASIFVLWVGSYCLSLVIGPTGRGGGYYHYRGLFDNPLTLSGMFAVNALIVWLAIGLILDGLKREQGGRFWSGVLFFLFWAVVRYIDLFSGVGGMLGAAAIFMFCGLFMLGIVYVWTVRKRKNRENETATENLPTMDDAPVLPSWMKTVRNTVLLLWQSERNILAAIALVAFLQFGVLGAMIANEMRPHISGTTIQVTTVPVDPRDLFRGDYVILLYEFSNARSIPGFNDFYSSASRQTVYVTMRQDGNLWKAARISQTKPEEGLFLRGVLHSHSNQIDFGIESYFVQEGTGKAIENAMRSNRESVIVELTVAPDGKTSIKTVHVR